MYPSHWGLRESPFRNGLDPQSFYPSPTHEEALARLHFLVEDHRRLGILLGPAGSGKSLLMEVFAAEIRRRGAAVARLELIGQEPAEVLGSLASQLGNHLDHSESAPVLWRVIADRLVEARYQKQSVVVFVDDADRAAQGVLPHLARLAKWDSSPGSWLTLIAAARPERMARLGSPLLDLAELRIDIQPWQPDDTENFLVKSLAEAGGRATVFAKPAIARLHALSHGIPRHVRQLADLALAAGAGNELSEIDGEVVDSVYRELSIAAAAEVSL